MHTCEILELDSLDEAMRSLEESYKLNGTELDELSTLRSEKVFNRPIRSWF
jgi:hypothetical protein